MIQPHEFQGMTASIFPSQENEVTLSKQAALSEFGREVRAALNQLPPEASKQLLSGYQEPSAQLLQTLEAAITSRELSIDHAAQEANLDKQWLSDHSQSPTDLHAADEWN